MASRKSRVIHEMLDEVAKERKYGESRHKAKLDEMQRAVESGTKYEQPRGIYSFETEATYKRQCKTFLRYVTEHHKEVRHFEDAKKYAGEYLQYCCDKGLSAATVKTYAHAIACAYHCNVAEFGFMIPTVSRDDIKRTRNAPSAAEVSGKTQTIHEFATATGARRGGLLRLTTDCLRVGKDGHLEIFLDEKGGKKRWARVLPQYESIVIERFEQARERGDEAPLFAENIDHHIDIHACRAEYARMCYALYESEDAASGKLYRCRADRLGDVYDKGVLIAVSKELGHNCCDVVVNDYLK